METSEMKMTKKCPCCGRELPMEAFGLKTSSPDGKQSWCKECVSRKNKEYAARKKKEKRNEEMLAPVENRTHTPLSSFTPRELMEELAARGYRGKLTYTNVIDIEKL